jgi:membrane fusion protein, multidrug efflux system
MSEANDTSSDIDCEKPEPPPRRTNMRKATGKILTGFILCAGATLYFWVGGGGHKGAQAQPAAPPAPPVTVSQPLQREIVEWNEYTGQFAATESVELRARVSGYLTEIHFDDGQFVKKGDLLFVIDPRPFEIALASAQAQLEQGTARLDLAKAQLARAAELRQRDNIPASTYDERQAEVRSATGALESARAAIRSAQLDLEFTHVTAPMAGHISRHQVSLGNLVFGGSSPSTTLLTTIVSTDPIYCVFDLSEADLLSYQRAAAQGRLKLAGADSLPLEARLSDEKGWTLKGRLNFVENQVDPGSGTLRARAVFDNPDARIVAGQFARLRAPASEPHQALLVPDAAIVSDQSRKLLMVVHDDGTVEPKVVELGPLFEGLRVVRDGVGPADRVIINGIIRARPGAKVTAQPGKIEAAASAS